jgi:hypothetical protein
MNRQDALDEVKLIQQTINKGLLKNLKREIQAGKVSKSYLEDLDTLKVCIEFLKDYIDPDRHDNYDDYEE